MALLPEDINQINQLIGQYFSANLQAVKLSTLPLASTLEGLHTMGVDASNNSVRVSLQFVKDATTQASDAADLADQKAAFANGKALLAIEAAEAANNAAAATKPLRFTWDGTRLGLKFEGDPDFVYTDLKGATGNSLEFAWNGTQLGVRVEGQPAYTEVELGGKDAYQIALALDPTIGTEEEWIQSLKQPALDAAEAADAARLAIENDLAAKAAHGYGTEPQKTLKEVDDNLVQLAGEVNKKIGTELISAADFSLSGWYLLYSTGNISGAGEYTTTEKKWVSEGTIIEVRAIGTPTVAILAVYDESESYIQAESIAGDNTLKTATFQVPSGGRYIAISTTIAEVNNSYARIYQLFQERSTLHDDVLLALSNSDVKLKSLEQVELSTKNEVLFPCFVRNKADLSSLNTQYMPGFTRKLKYQAFKGLKLYGFDRTKKYTVSHFWVDSYDADRFYRIIIRQWNGASWESYFDTGNTSKTTLGIVDGKIFTWDKTIGTKRMIAQIDFSNLAINDNSTLNSGEPDLLINPDCIYDQELSKTANVEFNSLTIGGVPINPDSSISILNVSGLKPYFNSRRKPTFAFIWDDLNSTDALVFSVFQEYGFLPSFALMSNNLNAGNATEYQNYYMKGCTILAHSISHPAMSNPATITYEEVDNQMKTSKEIIESYGMRVSGWVTPQSSLDISFFPLMEKNFGYGFTGLNSGLFNSTVDPLKMNRYGIESAMSNHDHTTIINRIDSAIANNELVVFYGHKLPSTYLNGDSTPYVTEDDLRFVLDYLKTKTDDNLCQVLSADEAVYQYYKHPFI